MKFVLVLIVAFVAFQATSASTLRDDSELVKTIKEVLQKFTELSENAFAKIEDFVNDYTSNKEAKNKEIVADVDGVGYQVTEEVVLEIGKLFDDMEPTASENGKKAMTCIRQEKQQVFTAVNSSVDGVTTCVLTTIPTLVTKADDLLKALNDSLAILKTADDKLQQCIFGEVCLIQLISDLSPLANEFKPLYDGVTKLIDGVSSVIPNQGACFKNEMPNILKNIVNIFDEVIDCIDT